MKLYDLELSGNCYKIRLFLSILAIEYTRMSVNVGQGELKGSKFLKMNPNGLVPVLIDGSTTVYDSSAILTYLAKTYADECWLPAEIVEFSNVIKWLVFEQSDIRYGLARARAIKLSMPTPLAKLGTLEDSQALAIAALGALNRQLTATDWLAGGSSVTICDIACYSYTALASDGGLFLEEFPAIRGWMDSIQSLNGYIEPPVIN
ncbi:MAG: glutathione S-transferase family protein [Gammaproteobacteria bacterium]|nr:glutathione S-transferase family protein [Gammaproteobacteria bacterium]